MRFQQLIACLLPHRGHLLLASVLMVVQSLGLLATPWFAGRFAAGLMGEPPLGAFSTGQVLGLWLGLFVVQAVVSFFSTYLLTRSGGRILAQLSNRLYDHLQALPLGYFQQQSRGSVLALLSNDVAIISHFVTGTLAGLAPMLLVLAGSWLLMARLDAVVAMLVALLIPLFFLVLKLMGRGIRPVAAALIRKQADLLAIAEENLGLLPLIKSFNREVTESRRFQRQTAAVLSLRTRQLRQQAMLSPALQLLASGGILLVLCVSSARCRRANCPYPRWSASCSTACCLPGRSAAWPISTARCSRPGGR